MPWRCSPQMATRSTPHNAGSNGRSKFPYHRGFDGGAPRQTSIGKPSQPEHVPQVSYQYQARQTGRSERPAGQSDRPLNCIPPAVFLDGLVQQGPNNRQPNGQRNDGPQKFWGSVSDHAQTSVPSVQFWHNLNPGPVCEHRRAELLIALTFARFPGIRHRPKLGPCRAGVFVETARYNLPIPSEDSSLPHPPTAVEHGVAQGPSARRVAVVAPQTGSSVNSGWPSLGSSSWAVFTTNSSTPQRRAMARIVGSWCSFGPTTRNCHTHEGCPCADASGFQNVAGRFQYFFEAPATR